MCKQGQEDSIRARNKAVIPTIYREELGSSSSEEENSDSTTSDMFRCGSQGLNSSLKKISEII